MADTNVKKFLGTEALEALVTQIKAEDAKVNAAALTAVSTLETGKVDVNAAAIAKLNGDATTEGSVAKAVADAQGALQANIEAVDEKADKNAEDIAAINNADTGILAQAKEYADGKDEAIEDAKTAANTAQGEVDALEEVVAAMYTNEQIDAAIKVEADRALAAEKVNADAIAAINNETTGILATAKGYTDTEVGKVQTAVDNLDTFVGDLPEGATATTVVGYIDEVADAIIAQGYDDTELAAKVDKNAEDIAAVKEDIDAFLEAAEVGEAAVDTLKEIQAYITTDGEAAAQMTADIAANAKAIEDLGKEVGDAATEEAEATGLYKVIADAEAAAKTHADNAIAGLDVTDAAVEGQYVSAVSETDGKITVTRAALPDYTEVYEAKGAAAAVQGETTTTVAAVEANVAAIKDGETINSFAAVETAIADVEAAVGEFEPITTEEVNALFAAE